MAQRLQNLSWLAQNLTLRDVPGLWKRWLDKLTRSEFPHYYFQVRDYSLCGYERLRGLYEAVDRTVRDGVPGDVVECGAARGGSAALMGLILADRRADRKVWVFDTFEGMPPPTKSDPDYDRAVAFVGQCLGTLEEVRDLFRRLHLLDRAVFVKGLFEDTVPKTDVGPISVLHLDGDWYSSVKVCLDHLYDRLSPGAVIQIDDYGHWEGARKAVEEFRTARGIRASLRYVDYTGRQWVKS
jgi:hypothetical protein